MQDAPKILIVEDHPAIRNLLITLFKNAGYEITEAPDGAMGYNEAQRGGFSVILLDLKMPQMDGIAFLKQLHRFPPQNPNGPTIVFSSHSYDYAQKEAMKAGAAAFIIKDDLAEMDLVAEVERIIKNHAAQSKTPQAPQSS
jgi:CheY-like chemotaxis protein